MAKEFVFYVTEDAELTTLGKVVEFVKGYAGEGSVQHPVSQLVVDSIRDAVAADGIYPALAGSWFYTGSGGDFVHVLAKGALKEECNATLQLEIERISILEELKQHSNLLVDLPPEKYADAVAILRRLPKVVLSTLFRIENIPPVRVSEKTSRDGGAKAQIELSESERGTITANIVEAIKRDKFPATPSAKSDLKDYDYEIRVGGKRDYHSTAKANMVYSELFSGDDLLVSEKGDKPNDNRKKKMMLNGQDVEYFRRAKERLGIK
ncbi:hypothetical protein K6R49_003745 [Escherichia coli]|nr:hypothetical protein [Escherichia coli]MBJ0329713.1 hypothetical protein [Escherichia coli]